MDELLRAVAADFSLYGNVREALLTGPKVGGGDGGFADDVYCEMCARVVGAVRSMPDQFGRPFECEASLAEHNLALRDTPTA